MKKAYRITGTCMVSCYTIVIADSEKEAEQISKQRVIQQAPNNMGGDKHTEFVIEDFDGDIDNIEINEED